MANDPQDAVLPLGNAVLVLHLGGDVRRFRMHSASLKRLPDGRVRLGFEGKQGSAAIAMPKVMFWRITSEFHDRSIAADEPKQPGRRTRGKRS